MLCNSSSLNVSAQHIILVDCCFTTAGSIIIISFNIVISFTQLPLNIFVMYLLVHQWLQNPAKSKSHSDVFTFQMVTVGLMTVLASLLLCLGIHFCMLQLVSVVLNIFIVLFYGELFFHLLTCLDRYLAVAKPVTYLSLRSDKGIRIRNIIIACVWLVGFPSLTMGFIRESEFIFIYCIMVFFLIIMIFCNIRILFILIRPLPGDNRQPKADQSKMKAFYTILIIMTALMLKFGWDTISGRLIYLVQLQWELKCVIMMSTIWTTLPINMVLPLLLLYRKRKQIF